MLFSTPSLFPHSACSRFLQAPYYAAQTLRYVGKTSHVALHCLSSCAFWLCKTSQPPGLYFIGHSIFISVLVTISLKVLLETHLLTWITWITLVFRYYVLCYSEIHAVALHRVLIHVFQCASAFSRGSWQ